MVIELIIDFEIKFLDQVCIGSGQPSIRGADISIAEYQGILPPSSFKGVLRKASNRVVKLVDSQWDQCPYIEPHDIRRYCMDKKGELKREHEWLKIYGIPGYSEDYITPLHVSGLKIRSVAKEPPPVYTYTHTSIQQSTLTVRKGALYAIEYLPIGTIVSGKLVLYIKTSSSDRYGIELSKIDKYLKLILLSLIESTSIGIGRYSKPFTIRITNRDEVIRKLEENHISVSDDVKELLTLLSKEYNPFTWFKGDIK